MFRRAFWLLASTLALAACGGGQPYAPGQIGVGAMPAPSQAQPAGQGIAILAPLTGPNAELGQALVQAAKLALQDPVAPPLDVRDTGGNPSQAASAASAAVAAGAGIIIGPLTSAETGAVAGAVRGSGVPVLAFTNDPAQAQPGVWPLGITPGQQVRRLVGAQLSRSGDAGQRFAAVLPDNVFGSTMADALRQALASAGAPAPDIHIYPAGNNQAIAAAMRSVSHYAERRGPIDEKIRRAREKRTPEGRREVAELTRTPIPPAPFDALLLAEQGERLAWATSFLAYYDIGEPGVRLMGPALWASPMARAGADLRGAWYAAPDPAAREGYDQRYTQAYNSSPGGVTDLAFDAAALAGALAHDGGWSAASLCRPSGFAGVDGLLVLQPDGSVRRGLALFEVQRGGPVMIEPAPASISAPGI
jgi:branched-chain amino acid transport system substrate-binding protein